MLGVCAALCACACLLFGQAHIREIYQNSFRQHASTCMRMLLNSMFKLGLAPENPENLVRALDLDRIRPPCWDWYSRTDECRYLSSCEP